MFTTKLTWSDLVYLSNGALVTIELTVAAMAIGTALGIIFGFIRAGMPRISMPLAWFLDIPRCVPLPIQFVLFNSFKTVIGIKWSAFTVACFVLGLYTASYCTEVVRGGILAVPGNLRRASRSLGLSWWQDVFYIVIPLAVRVGFSGWLNLTLSVMKDTSLVFWIGIIELLRASQQLNIRLNEPFVIFFLAGVFYYVISWVVSNIGSRFENKWVIND
ncbi:ABC transporter type 1 [Bartonella apihabitans]|uniref:amino acid ABC transporter permease n=1 Tax=Bartonella TaxID=773 RepID=UPI0018DD9596|nr:MULTISPECIES: amino acid ABC transporter permease [Bartonella]MBH9995130.1 amino acid ABC transporter permease [Bartonella sp. P0291]MBH9996525.1 amino acid ABC transporter permease [Bartonella sp. M0192]MBH9998686.1 amino acid ABC transporter permease [Bartonella sp. M0191]MBI0008421.1 amino acid ABC transporter permease [Bartonella sp. M0193]MBI0009976.1 amino acid ABC transporter permease [Bartonella sp. M0176]